MAVAAKSVAQRFWPKVDKNGPVFADKGPCWLWTAAFDRQGYGQFRGEPGRPTRIHRAHRVAFLLHGGVIPERLELDHLCRRTACVNPAHLEAVTARVNTHRSQSTAGKNAKKTECPRGHPYAGENLYVCPSSGHRHCRECSRIFGKRHRTSTALLDALAAKGSPLPKGDA